MTLPDFLLARIVEDEVTATFRRWHEADCSHIPAAGSDYTYPCDCGVPERVKAECEAKRRIVEEYAKVARNDTGAAEPEYAYGWAEGLGQAVRLLALPFADHPDYREEWRP